MDRACQLACPNVVTFTWLWTSLYRFHYSVFTAAECHHIQGLLISSPRGCNTSVATWTQLLSNFPPPATILLVTGPLGALISDFSSLSLLGNIFEITVIQVFLILEWGHLWVLHFTSLDLSDWLQEISVQISWFCF